MTVTNETTRIDYSTGGGSQFPFSFPITGPTDLKVILVNAAGVETVLTYSSGYSVEPATPDDYSNGGHIVTLDANGDPYTYPAGGTLIVMRNLGYTQEGDYISGDPFPAAAHESALDRLVMLVQQLKEGLDRALKVPISQDEIDMLVQDGAELAGKVFGLNSAGDGIQMYATTQPVGNMDASNVDIDSIVGKTVDDLFDGDKDTDIKPKDVDAVNVTASTKVNTPLVTADDMTEKTADHGIDIEGVNHKDGIVANHAPFRGETSGLHIKRFGNTQVKISPAVGATGEIVLYDSAGTPLKKTFTQQTCTITVSGAGGLDTGAEAPSTLYYVWLIFNSTTSTVSSLLSTSSTNPTMPAGYDYKALVGLVYNDASGNFEEVGTYRVPFGKYIDFDYAHEPVTINTGASYTFTFNFSTTPGSLSTRAVIISVRGDVDNNLSWKAWDRTTFYHGFQSGGQGTAPAAPADPGANKINVIVRNNSGSNQTVYARATVIGVR